MFWLQLGSSWQAGAWKRQWKYFFDLKCNLLAWGYRLLLFFSLKDLWPRSHTSRLCDHFQLLSFLHITFALVFHIWKIRHRLTLRPFSPGWQTVAGRHRPLWHIVPCQDNVTHTAPDGSYFIILYSFSKFTSLLFIFYLINMILIIHISSGHIAPCL